MASQKIFAPNADSRVDTSGKFINGYLSGEQLPAKELNDLFFRHSTDHVLGSASQLIAGECTMKWNGANFVDKSDATVSFSNYDRISIVGSDLLTANMILPSVDGLKMRSINGAKILLGTGTPKRIIYLGNDPDFDILTDAKFDELARSLSNDLKRFIAFRGIGGKIIANGDICYNKSTSGEIVTFDTAPTNPYYIRMDGHAEAWDEDSSVNTFAWFRQLNKNLNGWRDGAETQSRFTLESLISSAPYKFNVNIANRFFSDASSVDSDINTRISPQPAINATADFTNTSSTVTFSAIGNIKNGMRLNGASAQGIPDGATGTTILVDISGNTAVMVDALTGSEVAATSTSSGISTTIDNSGAASGSSQQNAIQGHWHNAVLEATAVLGSGVANARGIRSKGSAKTDFATHWGAGDPVSDVSSGTTRTSSDTRPDSTQILTYYRP